MLGCPSSRTGCAVTIVSGRPAVKGRGSETGPAFAMSSSISFSGGQPALGMSGFGIDVLVVIVNFSGGVGTDPVVGSGSACTAGSPSDTIEALGTVLGSAGLVATLSSSIRFSGRPAVKGRDSEIGPAVALSSSIGFLGGPALGMSKFGIDVLVAMPNSIGLGISRNCEYGLALGQSFMLTLDSTSLLLPPKGSFSAAIRRAGREGYGEA